MSPTFVQGGNDMPRLQPQGDSFHCSDAQPYLRTGVRSQAVCSRSCRTAEPTVLLNWTRFRNARLGSLCKKHPNARTLDSAHERRSQFAKPPGSNRMCTFAAGARMSGNTWGSAWRFRSRSARRAYLIKACPPRSRRRRAASGDRRGRVAACAACRTGGSTCSFRTGLAVSARASTRDRWSPHAGR